MLYVLFIITIFHKLPTKDIPASRTQAGQGLICVTRLCIQEQTQHPLQGTQYCSPPWVSKGPEATQDFVLGVGMWPLRVTGFLVFPRVTGGCLPSPFGGKHSLGSPGLTFPGHKCPWVLLLWVGSCVVGGSRSLTHPGKAWPTGMDTVQSRPLLSLPSVSSTGLVLRSCF